MKASELLKQLQGRGDPEVRIVLNQPSMPAVRTVGVKSASIGIDWTHGKLLLRTDEPIVSKPKTKKKRRDEWADERIALNTAKSDHMALLASSMRLLSKVKDVVGSLGFIDPEFLQAVAMR